MRASQRSHIHKAVNSREPHRVSSPIQYATGAVVPQTGIYLFQHTCSRLPQEIIVAREVLLVSGERFPACKACGEELRFHLVRTAPYIFHDEDFMPNA